MTKACYTITITDTRHSRVRIDFDNHDAAFEFVRLAAAHPKVTNIEYPEYGTTLCKTAAQGVDLLNAWCQ